jgi:hypothetical protein
VRRASDTVAFRVGSGDAGAGLGTGGGEADQLAVAQEALDRRTTSSATGLCLECGVPGPCAHRETAVKVFSRCLRLPRRIPGLSRPELIGARRVETGR